MTGKKHTIGIIAGGGQLPFLLARAAREAGLRVIAVGIKEETDPGLAEEVDHLTILGMGQLGRLIKTFHKHGVQRAMMGGAIRKTRLFRDFWPDLKAINEFRKLRRRGDDRLLSGLAQVLMREGVEIMAAHELVPQLVSTEGIYTQRGPDQREIDDIALGWEVAGQLGRLDVGQCVVTCRGMVTAVEAVEGTDRAIERGGLLAGGGAVVVKRSKPGQDMRFDLPAVGPVTVEAMASAGCSCLAVEAGRALVFDRREMAARADKYGICVLGLHHPASGPGE